MNKTKRSFLKVIADNKPGALAEIARLLARVKINIDDMTAIGFGEKGLVILLASDHVKAAQILQDHGYSVLSDQGFVVKLENKPGTMAKVTGLLAKNGVNISAISAIGKAKGFCYFVLTADNMKKARKLLKEYIV